jgi:protein TonB
MPEGGVEKIVGTIARNLHYPDSCELPGGRIIIAFVVEADGTIDNETVVRDPCGNDHLLSNRLFDIVKKTKWTPGKMNGKPVATRYSLPLTICLGSDD